MRTRYVGDIALLGAPQKALPKSDTCPTPPDGYCGPINPESIVV
jgi:hypothetical protein